MIVSGFFDGIRVQTSAKGTVYGDVYFRGMTENGEPDFEQIKVRTFDGAVVKACQNLEKDDVVNLELKLRDATVTAVSK